MTSTLILLRHGHSVWNEKNIFTGWVDVGLTEQGKAEARRAGELIAASGLEPRVLHTSLLKRAIHTANIALEVAELDWLPVKRSWRLNERHYGALQGLNKAETLAAHGEELFMTWRRSFDTPPPPLADDAEYSQVHDPRYVGIDGDVPRTESLKLVIDRMLPYWHAEITSDLAAGRTVLVTAHGNSLRALVMAIEGLTPDEILAREIGTGEPTVYKIGPDGKLVERLKL